MGSAQDVQLQVVLSHGPQHLGDPLAVHRPPGQVPEVDQVREPLKQDLECTDGQLRGFVDVEALQAAGVSHPRDADTEVGIG